MLLVKSTLLVYSEDNQQYYLSELELKYEKSWEKISFTITAMSNKSKQINDDDNYIRC